VIRKIKNDNASWLINSLVDNEFLMSTNPVIAGSSAVAVYKACNLYDTKYKFNEFRNKLEKSIRNVGIDKFGDVDIWFLDSNDIHNESNINYNIISDSPSDIIRVGGGDGLSLKSESKWANTYALRRSYRGQNKIAINHGTNMFQFIKSKPKSPEELLKTFDFINSSVAWYDGTLYYDSRIDDAFGSLELRMNSFSGYKKSSTATKVFNGLRAFKYAKRYGLDFSEELMDKVFNAYCESVDIDYSQYNEKVLELEILYGKKISSPDTLKSMVAGFHKCFGIFIDMKYFKLEYATYLINSSSHLYKLSEYFDKK
jgi:hypothetical protein